MTTSVDELLRGTLADPDGSGTLHVPVRAVAIEASLVDEEADRVAALGLTGRALVVSDRNTHAAMGQRVERALASRFDVDAHVFQGMPHADARTVDVLADVAARSDFLVAVGSGTINDLCKTAAARLGRPYVVFGTAPSMNGYTSVNAAITVQGHKRSVAARAPLGVFLDLQVLAAAPVRLIRAGLGDSLCRGTAQADWLLAHLLRDEPYREAPFVLLRAEEDRLIESGAALVGGDLDAMAVLARTLVLSGFGMTICGGSYPASQGEHLISHYLDMRGVTEASVSFHGEQIGVTTLTMARLQERLLDGPAPLVRPTSTTRDDLVRHFGGELGASCWEELAKKRLDEAAAREMRDRLLRGGLLVQRRLAGVTRPASEIQAALVAAGAPRRPEDLGWPRHIYADAILHAREIRARYTFLDLAADSGVLNREWVEKELLR